MFSFFTIERNDIMKELWWTLITDDPKKETIGNSIPSKTLELSADISADVENLFNDMLPTGNFPDNMKIADIIPVFKKKDPLKKEKENHRPVSVLSAISKIIEKLMQKQIVGYMEKFFPILMWL